MLAGVEVVAVNAYTVVLGAATAGDLGAVPPVVAHYGATALDHHRVALEAWNRVLVAAERPAVTQPPADLAITINEQLGAITDGAELLDVAFIIERIAAATYLDAVHTLVSEPAIRLAGSILSVDRQRMALLLFADGQYPVPETLASNEFTYVAEPREPRGARPAPRGRAKLIYRQGPWHGLDDVEFATMTYSRLVQPPPPHAPSTKAAAAVSQRVWGSVPGGVVVGSAVHDGVAGG